MVTDLKNEAFFSFCLSSDIMKVRNANKTGIFKYFSKSVGVLAENY